MLCRFQIPIAALLMLGLSTTVALAGKPVPLKLTVSISPSKIIEGSSASGTVTHNSSSLSSAVTVTLISSKTTEATVPATVTILAGTNTANFTVTAINDGITDGPQSVSITTTAAGYASASANLIVDDVPTFQYELTIPQMPSDAIGGVQVNDLNNRGQVVGWYLAVQGQKAFLYDPSIPGGTIDLSALNLPGIPVGYQISSVVGINDHQVLVGYLTNDFNQSGNRTAFALDWATEHPVVDLLPNMESTLSYGRKINENGDILGLYNGLSTESLEYLFNPGIYAGDPEIRALRDGQAFDFSNDATAPLPYGGTLLNNPVGNSPAQVAGTDPNGIAFRYTTGPQPIYETFLEIDLSGFVWGINDAGTFCGTVRVTSSGKGKQTKTIVPFRFNTSVETLPNVDSSYVRGINNSGDVIGDGVYRDNQGWIPARDLPVVGNANDMFTWFASPSRPDLMCISDRVTPDDVGFIAGRISDGSNNVLFLLTPVPVP